MEEAVVLGVMLVLTIMLTGVSSFEFWASQPRVLVAPGGDTTVTCEADVPLTDCRFYFPSFGYLEPIPNRITTFKGTTMEYSFNGDRCSVDLRGVHGVFYNLVACRGRDKNGIYKATELSLAVTTFAPFQLDIDAPEHLGVVLPGQDFSFVCRSPESLTHCGLWLPNNDIIDLSMGAASVPTKNYTFQYEYFGKGLAYGECGAKFKHVDENLNGVVWCSAQSSATTSQYDFINLIVATPPQTLQLDLSGNDLYDGDSLKATCSALNARPMPTITWYMDDDVITTGVYNVTPESPHWPDPHNKMSLTQTLTRTLQPEDNGRELKCVVGNVALPGGGKRTIKKQIHVRSNATFTFKANPAHVHVTTGGEVTVRCESNAPLSDCRFRLPELGFLDISAELHKDVHRLIPNVTRVYHFRGTKIEYFWRGQTCGLTLRRVSEDLDGVVACRGRNKFSEYRTAEIMLAVSKLVPFDLKIDKRHAVVLPGQSLTFLCSSPLPLIYCAVWLPDDEILDMTQGHASKPSRPHDFHYEYRGAGLDAGECGVTFNNITERLNGHVWCEGQSEDATDQSDYMTVIVAKRPNPPQLLVSPREYNIGDTLEASCIVRNSRPPATITWYLGDQQVTEGVHSMEDTTWSWEYEKQTVTSNLTRTLSEQDGGKELRCVASHVTLPGGKAENKMTIAFTMDKDSKDPAFHPNRKLVNSPTCGTINIDTRIISGKETGLFEFPWMALVIYNTANGPIYGCGGSLVSKQFVLTAAHCVTNLPNGYTIAQVRLGEHNYERELDCVERHGELVCAPYPQNFTAVKVIAHPGFTNMQLNNDIALVKLDRPASLSDSVGTICLPDGKSVKNLHETVKTMIVAGWGVTENGTQSAELRAVKLPIVSNQVCAEHYVKRKFLVSVSQICAGGSEGRDSCKGDSGSPLMNVDVAKSRFVQYGIVSYGAGVCGTNVPTVYTNVDHFVRWMLDSMD